MKLNSLVYFVLFVLSFYSCRDKGSSSINLDFKRSSTNFKKDNDSLFKFSIVNESIVSYDANGNTTKNVSKSHFFISCKLSKDTRSTLLLNVSYDSLYVYQNVGGVESIYNGDTSLYYSSPIDQLLSEIKRDGIKARLDGKGKIISVYGYDSLIDRIISKINPGVVGVQNSITLNIKDVLKNLVIEKGVNQLFGLLPDSNLFIGKKWNQNELKKDEFGMTSNNSFEIVDIDSSIIKIAGVGHVFTDVNSETMFAGFKTKADIKGSSAINYIIDKSQGFLYSYHLEVKTSGSLNVMERTFPISTSNIVTISRIE